jgi:hypothetical protein
VQLQRLARAFGGSENSIAREAFEAGLSIIVAKKLAAVQELSRAASRRK